MDIEQSVKTYTFEDGEIQRVQLAKLPPGFSPDFFHTSFSPDAFNGIIDVLDKFQISRYPFLFGTMVFFHIPEGVEVPAFEGAHNYGKVSDPNIKASVLFKKRFRNGRFVPANDAEQQFVDKLKAAGTFRVLRGKRSKVVPMPFSEHFDYMSSTEADAKLKVNSNFFIMDSFDCATVYDSVGTPIGLCVKDGRVINPPLYEREAVIVRENSTSVEMPRLTDCTFDIGGKEFIPGINCTVFERPARKITKRCKGTDIVIIGTQVKAVKKGGGTEIPCVGFVLHSDMPEAQSITPETEVIIKGFEDVLFAVQCGNSIMRNGVPAGHFISKYYNIRKLFGVPYPPCFYPLDYDNSRAARIAIGANKCGSICILWAEGAAKIGHEKGKDSRGASLSDMELFCRDFDIVNAINLDGGGSAQLLLKNRRSLMISDRKNDGSENERAIPLGLIVR